MWTRAKLRGHPKALITKVVEETLLLAWLMPQGMVTSLEILVIGMGNRGSKSVKRKITVKEQRADGSSEKYFFCKVCSKRQGNLF